MKMKLTAAAAVCLALLCGCSDTGNNTSNKAQITSTTSDSYIDGTVMTPLQIAEPEEETAMTIAEKSPEEYSYLSNTFFIGDTIETGAVKSGVITEDRGCNVAFSERLSNMTVNGVTLADAAAASGCPYIYVCVGDGDIMAEVSKEAYTRAILDFVAELREKQPASVVTVLSNCLTTQNAASYNSALEKAVTGLMDMNVHYIDINLCLSDSATGLVKDMYLSASGDMSLSSDGISAVFDMIYNERYSDVISTDSRLRYMYPDIVTEPRGSYTVTEPKAAYLTFDDGPSDHTDEILDILKRNDIKATFFVTGRSVSTHEEQLKREIEEGHVVGLHSQSHDYELIYSSPEAFLDDFAIVYYKYYDITGIRPWLFRFPGGSYNNHNKNSADAIIAEMNRRGFSYFDWNCATSDALNGSTYESCMEEFKESAYSNHCLVLMHDTISLTPEYLQEMIDYLRDEGYVFETVENADGMHFHRPASWDEPEETGETTME